MPDLTVNSETVLDDVALEGYDEVGTNSVRDDVVGLAARRLVALLRRAGVPESNIDSTNAPELEALGAALWLEAYWAVLAKDLSEDEGFESKRDYWAKKVKEEREIILGEPVQLTGVTSDRPRGNLRWIQATP